MRLRLVSDHMDGLKPQGMAEILLVLLYQGSLIKRQLKLQHLQKDSNDGVKLCTFDQSNRKETYKTHCGAKSISFLLHFLGKGEGQGLDGLRCLPLDVWVLARPLQLHTVTPLVCIEKLDDELAPPLHQESLPVRSADLAGLGESWAALWS